MFKTDTVAATLFFEKVVKKNGIAEDRKVLLSKIANSINSYLTDNKTVNLNFICTHNSRRSQLSQVWAAFAAAYYNINIQSFSGGTEATAFHRNTVKTLQKAGFTFKVKEFSHQNPVYTIHCDEPNFEVIGFSKVYDDPANKQPFIAITTCNDADANCPYIPEALERFHLPFIDPKTSDFTDEQDEFYLKINKQIAGEIGYLFSLIN